MRQTVNVLLALLIASLFFAAGMLVANRYNEKAALERKDALERQYLRLTAKADADDPCRPYKYTAPRGFNPSLLRRFEEKMKSNGSATIQFKNDNEKENKK